MIYRALSNVLHGWKHRTRQFIAATVFTFFICSAGADAQNLLTNAGLEGVDGFQIPAGSCPKPNNWFWVYQCVPELEPPTWWFPFWNPGPSAVDPNTNYRRPEFRVYAWRDGPHYEYEGSKYLVFFGFFGAIDAGIYQKVNVTPGQMYEFSYQGFAWSNCVGGKEGVSGEGCVNFPPDQAVFKAGIDPTGGTNYTSSNIVWGQPQSIYDEWGPVSVRTQAQSSMITVFVRCTFWHNYIEHNDAHVDALKLVPVGPEIGLNPTLVTREAFIGDPVADGSFTVANVGGLGTLNYTITTDAPWVDVTPTSGSSAGEADTITVSFDPTIVPGGTHFANITIASPDALQSPKTVTAKLVIHTVGPDLDGDADVDQSDFGLFQACITGPGVPPTLACLNADFDNDQDVDADDFGVLQACYSTPGIDASRDCDQ